METLNIVTQNGLNTVQLKNSTTANNSLVKRACNTLVFQELLASLLTVLAWQ